MRFPILEQAYPLSQNQIDFYKKNAFIKLKEVLDAETLAYYNKIITNKVDELNRQAIPLHQRDTYGKAFVQLFNLWREDPQIKTFTFSKRLAQLAADLMEVEGVRMYHDQALIPIKTLDFDRGVNVTLGLPFIRTSPDHGTAFDIAGKGIANPTSMAAAIDMAAQMVARRAAAKVA